MSYIYPDQLVSSLLNIQPSALARKTSNQNIPSPPLHVKINDQCGPEFVWGHFHFRQQLTEISDKKAPYPQR